MLMCNQIISSLLSSITLEDCQYKANFVDKVAKAGENNQQIVIYCNQGKYYCKAIGSPYLLAMAKWLTKLLQENKLVIYKTINIAELQCKFSLPRNKRQDALLILQLIEQLHNE